MGVRVVALFAIALLACPSGAGKGTKKFTDSCATDDECVSGRCLPSTDGEDGYCTNECELDIDCANEQTLFCCERLGEKAYCTQPATGECRAAQLGSGCQGEGDPFCARSQLFCADAGGRQVCTFECVTTDDCAEVRGAVCGNIGNGQLACIPPDINNLVRLTPDCAGDRDCTGEGEICQMVLDNEVDPRAYVLHCTSSQKYGPSPAYSTCTANRQCDRFFCIDNVCPATCSNDSHCKPGFVCEPVGLPVPTDQGTAGSTTTIIGLCAKQAGSYRPCDAATSSCPSGESCQVAVRFDGGADSVCRAFPTDPSTMPAVSTTYAKTDEPCSRFVDDDNNADTPNVWQGLVNGEIKLCESDVCLAPGYCTSPCRKDQDCVAGPAGPQPPSDLVCVYEPFFSHCERAKGSGKNDGDACSAASVRLADGQCASLFCSNGACTARKAEGSDCGRANECRSFVCLSGKCAKLCRADNDCGGTGHVCDTLPQGFDVFGTPTTPLDDAVDLPSLCQDLPGADLTSCPDNACGAGLVCMPVGAPDGGLRGVCASPNSGAAVGETCTADATCQTKLCLGFGSGTSGRCASVCLDSSDCPQSTRCIPTTVSGTAATKLCLVPNGTAEDDAACSTPGDCKSNLCIDGKCAAMCPRGVNPGMSCAAGKPCALVAVPLSPRLSPDLFDDAFDFIAACVPGAVAFAGDPAACASPKQFVFRPTDAGTLVGACLTPLEDALAEGKDCQGAAECQSGLCVDHKCAKPCGVTPADTCGTTTKCDVGARAQLDKNNSLTAVAPACRKACTADTDCDSTSLCEADPGGGAPRFCRQKCTADKDCSPGQTCPAGTPQVCVN